LLLSVLWHSLDVQSLPHRSAPIGSEFGPKAPTPSDTPQDAHQQQAPCQGDALAQHQASPDAGPDEPASMKGKTHATGKKRGRRLLQQLRSQAASPGGTTPIRERKGVDVMGN